MQECRRVGAQLAASSVHCIGRGLLSVQLGDQFQPGREQTLAQRFAQAAVGGRGSWLKNSRFPQ